ncbi:MAG: flippase activity-associated protein Agl23, partial [Dehalococcoidia bacterium]
MTSTDIQTMPSVAAGEQPNRWIPPLDKWEFVAWGAILVLAIVSRLWDLGGRGMHYDEVLHVWYSWLFVDGGGYQHNPLTHGPFLYHGNALLYWLFGANDVTGRLLPALFGIALVGLPFFFRKELNRYGALALGVLLLVSPMVLYFSRFSRNDVYMAVFVLALVLVMQRYSERRGTPLLFAWVVLWAFAFSSKETAFIFAGIFGLFLLLPSARHYWEWVRGRAKLSDLPPSGELFLVLATVSAPLWAPLSGLIQGIFDVIMVNPDAGAHGVVAGEVFRADAPTGAPVGGALYIAAVLAIVMFAVAAFLGLLWDRRRWPLLLSAFVAIWLPLHTSMFTNMEGFFTGLWGSLGYWIAQHGVERAGQPLYYYAITMSVYEFLILVPALAGGVYLVFKGKAFDIFLVYFALMNFILFSYAGERMPWLTVPIALSAALVAGRTIGLMVQSARRSHLAPAAFLGGLGLMVMVPFAFARAVGAESPLSDAGFW